MHTTVPTAAILLAVYNYYANGNNLHELWSNDRRLYGYYATKYAPYINSVVEKCLGHASRQLSVALDRSAPPLVYRTVLRHVHHHGNTSLQLGVAANRPDPWQQSYLQALHHAKSGAFLLFLHECCGEAVGRNMAFLCRSSYWNPRARFLVVITAPVTSQHIQLLFQHLWQYKILDVVILFHCPNVSTNNDGNIRAVTYNPFVCKNCSPAVIDVTEAIYHGNTCSAYFNKLLNLHKSTMKVSIFPFPPNVIPIKGTDRLKGADWSLMETLLSHINAELQIVPGDKYTYGKRFENGTIIGSSGEIASGRADIGFNSRVQKLDWMDKVEYLYPHKQDDMVVVVPNSKRIPQYQNLFLPFDRWTWLCACCSLPFTVIGWHSIHWLSKFITSSAVPTKMFSIIFFDTFSSFVSVSLPTMPRVPSERVFLLFWVLFSLVITSAYQGSLTSFLAVPQYLPTIDTLQQLLGSGLPVTVHPGLSFIWKHDIINDKVSILKKRIIFSTDMNTAYNETAYYSNNSAVRVSSVAKLIIRQNEYVCQGRSLLHTVKERVVMNHSPYAVTRHSPYVPRFEELIGRLKGSGIYEKWYGDMMYEYFLTKELVRISNEPIPPESLTLNHLQTGFYIFLLGCFFSITVFLCEIYKRKLPLDLASTLKKLSFV